MLELADYIETTPWWKLQWHLWTRKRPWPSATELLAKLAGDDDVAADANMADEETYLTHTNPSQEKDSPPLTHTITPKASPIFSDSEDSGIVPTEHPPSSFRTDTPGGDIFLENENG